MNQTELFNVSLHTKKVIDELTEYITNYIAFESSNKPPSSYAITMKRTVDRMLTYHKIVFNNIGAKLKITRENLEDTVLNSLDHMFQDNNIHWGRIVSVFTFYGVLARYCIRSNMGDIVNKIKQKQKDYILRRFGLWIDREGGWDSFNKHFPPQNQTENAIFFGFLWTFVVLGTLATLVILRRNAV